MTSTTRVGGRPPSLGFVPSLWFAWLIVTPGDLVKFSGSGYSVVWNYFPNALFSLLTPILLGDLLVKALLLVITVPLLFVGLFAGDQAGRQIKLKSLRLIYNLVFLCALTAAIDAITWGSPKSSSTSLRHPIVSPLGRDRQIAPLEIRCRFPRPGPQRGHSEDPQKRHKNDAIKASTQRAVPPAVFLISSLLMRPAFTFWSGTRTEVVLVGWTKKRPFLDRAAG
jgi:hypothetical protein